jgi:hypothetical protein
MATRITLVDHDGTEVAFDGTECGSSNRGFGYYALTTGKLVVARDGELNAILDDLDEIMKVADGLWSTDSSEAAAGIAEAFGFTIRLDRDEVAGSPVNPGVALRVAEVRAMLEGHRDDEHVYHVVRGWIRPLDRLVFGERANEGRSR